MSQVIRGAKYPDHLNVQTAVKWERSTQHNLGFRLVHDGGDQLAQGGFWDASGISRPVCSRFRPDTIKSFVGFRLVREEDT